MLAFAKKLVMTICIVCCAAMLGSCGSAEQETVAETETQAVTTAEETEEVTVAPPVIADNSYDEYTLTTPNGRIETVIVEELEIKERIGDGIIGTLYLGDAIEVEKDSGTAYEDVVFNGKEGVVQTKYLTKKVFDDNAQDFIFPDSYKRYLTEEDANSLNDEESVRLAINEIYARRGRIFNSEDLNERFLATEWYEAVTTPNEFDNNLDFYLNEYDKANIELLDAYRTDAFIATGPEDSANEPQRILYEESEETMSAKELYDNTPDVDLSQYYGTYWYFESNDRPQVYIKISPDEKHSDRAYLSYNYIDPYGPSGVAGKYIDKLNFGGTNILGTGWNEENDLGCYSASLFVTFDASETTFVYYIRQNTLPYGAYPRKDASGKLEKLE